MTTQRERRTDPYPLTWEIPTAVFAGSLLALVLGAQLGRSLANLAAGASWAWPAPTQLFRSTLGILQGDAAAGLGAIAPVAEPDTLLVWVLVIELLVMVVYAVLTWWCLHRWGPNRTLGVATVGEARQLLGRRRLYAARKVTRPDLYRQKVKR